MNPNFVRRIAANARISEHQLGLHGPTVSVTMFADRAEEVVMAVSMRSLGIDHLAVEERLALVEELWDSIAAESAKLPLTEAQRIELDRRIEEHAANPDDVVSWEEVRDSITVRLKA